MPHRSRLSLTQVSTLREFARRGTLAAAAEHLGYTAGAVSQHLSSLEATLGVALVERSGRHLVLTDAGRVMAQQAEELLTAESRAVSATRSAHSAVAGPLVVGTWGSTAAALLAPLVQRMSAQFPQVQVMSREVDLDEASTSVRDGEVDVAFGLDYADAPIPRDRSVNLLPLQPERFAVAVATGSVPLVEYVEVARLAELEWILPSESSQYGRAIRSGFRRLGFEPRVVHEVTDTSASLRLAAAGLGATMMTVLMRALNTDPALTHLRMRAPLTRQIVLMSRGDVPMRQAVRVFMNRASSLVDELLTDAEW